MQTSTTRVETFSDGVIAIMITIMVLGFKLPEFGNHPTTEDIKNHLLNIIPHVVAYLFSFVMIGILWTSHHHLFHLLKKTDNQLLRQNLFFLFWISLIPLVTGVMGASPFLAISTALYGCIMLMTTLTLSYMRAYTLRKELVHTDAKKELNMKIYRVSLMGKRRSYISCAAYFISIPLAFVSVYLAYVCFVIPLVLFFIPTGIDEEKLENSVMEKNPV